MNQLSQFANIVAERAMQIIKENRILPAAQEPAVQAVQEPPVQEPAAQITILLALSGGIDSTALLLSMSGFRQKFACRLHAAHFNHHLRGSESDQDAHY